MKPSFHEWATDQRLKGLVLGVLLLAVLALASYTYLTVKQAKYADNMYGPTTISVTGKGEVVQTPDVAKFSFSVQAEADSPETAQKESADAINTIVAYLKESGVAEADIKTTGYNLWPRYRDMPTPVYYGDDIPMMEVMPPTYDYNEDTVIGYTVEQTIEVKVRDTAQTGNLIAGVTDRGATNMSGLQFTLDDDSSAKAEARAKAVADAKEKAQQLADTLGVRLVRLQGFWEEEGGGYPMYDGYGGGIMERAAVLPELPPGENMITSVVNLTYEIR